MAQLAAAHAAVLVDVGTGDGSYVLRAAKDRPDALVIGVDANVDGMREASARAMKKPARGGAPNALFGRVPLEELPGDLEGLAHELTVLLPWGSLLRAVAAPDPSALERLRRTCRAGARVRVVFGHGAEADASAVKALALPDIEPASLESAYRAAGFEVSCRAMAVDDVARIGTTWAKKLAFSGRARVFVEIVGHVAPR